MKMTDTLRNHAWHTFHGIGSLLPRTGAILSALALLVSVHCVSAATASPPSGISYQGYLTDADGDPLASDPTNFTIQFRIYDAEQNGNLEWSESQSVTVDKGAFSVLLGEGSAITGEESFNFDIAKVFDETDASDRFVELTVGTGSTIAPRLRLLTSPYAFLASKAITADKLSTDSADAITFNGSDLVTVEQGLNVKGPSLLEDGLEILDGSSTGNVDDNAAGVGTLRVHEGSLHLRVDANEIQTVNTSDNTGAKLHLNHNSGDVRLGNTASTTEIYGDVVNVGGGTIKLATDTEITGTTAITGNASVSGNLGVGTTSPSKKLDVDGSATINGSLGVGTSSPSDLVHLQGSGQVRLRLDSTGTGGAAWQVQSGGPSDSFTGGLSFIHEEGNRRMTIKDDGNVYIQNRVGIGTSSPSHLLDIKGSDYARIGLTSTDSSGHAWELQSNGNSGSYPGGFNLVDRTVGATRFILKSDGNIYIPNKLGIGDSTPAVPLEIGSTSDYNFDRIARYGNTDNSDNSNTTQPISLRTSGGIVCAQHLWIQSDERLKDIQHRVSSAEALTAIQDLRITDYVMRDVVKFGDGVQFGVIAQELEKVMPNAVQMSEGFVPDIYLATKDVQFDRESQSLLVQLGQDHGLRPGEVVRLIMGSEQVEKEVLVVPDSESFKVGEWEHSVEEIFVYGREVKDLRTVDYDHVFLTGIAALQEVNHKLDQTNIELQESNKKLESDVVSLKEENSRLTEHLMSVLQRVERIESLMAGVEESDQPLVAVRHE